MEMRSKIDNEFEDEINIETIKMFCRKEGCAFIEYYLGDVNSLGIIITEDDFKIIELAPKEYIENIILGYIKLISNKPIKDINGSMSANRIYEWIFEPLEKYIPKKVKNLVIVPDGCLYYLPFETIMKKESTLKKNFSYLLDHYNIAYVPSISSMLILKEKRKNELKNCKDILAIGSPKYDLFRIKYDEIRKKVKNNNENSNSKEHIYVNLPYAKHEIKAIKSIFKREKKDIFIGTRASERVLKNGLLNRYKIIHFACHGYIDESFPFRSSLILSPEPDKGEDGFLRAHEISELDINAELVVLSACQSAHGPLEKAEGVLSLNRVFFTSGAKAVLSSLWQVNDRSSAELMKYFYRHLKKGMSIARALREAKLEMLKTKFNHPFYWAGFVLSGDGFATLFDQK
ncbi:MAG: CHAT domain-containing protein [Candidatus Methanomethylicaceae archaeon]